MRRNDLIFLALRFISQVLLSGEDPCGERAVGSQAYVQPITVWCNVILILNDLFP